MPLPDIQLDDRSFEDIVREARLRIPTYTPEWTDHNESDPGITLLQLFGWLTEMILYRLNKVPDKNYLKFLELVGITLTPPSPATADITFTLTSKDLGRSVLVPRGTRVALAASVDGGPVVFETEDDLNAVGGELVAVQGFDGGLFTLFSDADHPLKTSFAPFGPRPQARAALYLGFDRAFPAGSQRLRVYVDTQGLIEEGQGVAADDVAPSAPPVAASWEYWAGEAAQWRRLDVTADTTADLTRTGDVTFNPPADHVARKVGLKQRDQDPTLFWLRFRIVNILGPGYETAPLLENVAINTVTATGAVTVVGEALGASDGRPNQSYQLAKAPVLPDTLVLRVDEGKGPTVWKQVTDFAGSKRDDTHYTLDPPTGTVRFGDGEHGKIPLPLTNTMQNQLSPDLVDPRPVVNIRADAYRWGGGDRGNAGPGTITSLQTTIPFVASVTNLKASFGGADQETVQHARLRAPLEIRSGGRAVTADDFEYLAGQTPGARVKRAKALPLHNPKSAPIRPAGAGLDATPVPVPGVVTVVVVPDSRDSQPMPSGDTLRLVGDYLRRRCPVATELFVVAPKYRKVEVDARLIATPDFQGGSAAEAVTNKLLAFFHPLTGGPKGTGWVFGDPVSVSEVYRQILTTAGVHRIEPGSLTVFVDDKPVSDLADVPLASDEIVYSLRHTISARYKT